MTYSEITPPFFHHLRYGTYVLDFLFFTERLAIELDGESHSAASAPARDARRDAWLQAQGVRVLRFANRDVMENLEGVVTAIRMALKAPHPNPLPEGEGTTLMPTTPLLPSGEGRGEGCPQHDDTDHIR